MLTRSCDCWFLFYNQKPCRNGDVRPDLSSISEEIDSPRSPPPPPPRVFMVSEPFPNVQLRTLVSRSLSLEKREAFIFFLIAFKRIFRYITTIYILLPINMSFCVQRAKSYSDLTQYEEERQKEVIYTGVSVKALVRLLQN